MRLVARTADSYWRHKGALAGWLAREHQRATMRRTAQGASSSSSSSSYSRLAPARRLESILPHIQERAAAAVPANWPKYLAELRRFCESPRIRGMDYEQRLMRVVDIVLLPEEADAVAGGEWSRLLRVVGLCSVIADAVGPDDEVLDDEAKNRWIAGKKTDIACLRRLMGSMARVADLGL